VKHVLTITPIFGSFGVIVKCVLCEDPEPETVDYIWIDSNGTVFFDPGRSDGNSVDKLVLFMDRHGALGNEKT
jgi:hypothetical protein